jgi:hypothetical protein
VLRVPRVEPVPRVLRVSRALHKLSIGRVPTIRSLHEQWKKWVLHSASLGSYPCTNEEVGENTFLDEERIRLIPGPEGPFNRPMEMSHSTQWRTNVF